MKCQACDSTSGPLFRFPKVPRNYGAGDELQRFSLWRKFCKDHIEEGLSCIFIYQNFRLCASHFEDKYKFMDSGRLRLKYNAVPVLYPPDLPGSEVEDPAKKQQDEEAKLGLANLKIKLEFLKIKFVKLESRNYSLASKVHDAEKDAEEKMVEKTMQKPMPKPKPKPQSQSPKKLWETSDTNEIPLILEVSSDTPGLSNDP